MPLYAITRDDFEIRPHHRLATLPGGASRCNQYFAFNSCSDPVKCDVLDNIREHESMRERGGNSDDQRTPSSARSFATETLRVIKHDDLTRQ
jgi:hypothetical protein